jgi:hypothetical protein
MTNTDHGLRETLSRLNVPAMPAGMTARLSHITRRPQARGLTAMVSRFLPLDDLSFGLRHDLRYQAIAAGLILTLSLGAWQGLQFTHSYSGGGLSDDIALSIEADPVLAGAL